MIRYIDDNKDRYRVEPICAHLPIAPSTYYESKKRPASARRVRDDELKVRKKGDCSTSKRPAPCG